MNPLKEWKSEEVYDLLIDFYKANFLRAGMDPKTAEKMIISAWISKEKEGQEKIFSKIRKIFIDAKSFSKKEVSEIDPIKLLDLSKVKKFLDIGSNRLSTLNYCAEHCPNIESLIGMDIIPQHGKFFDPDRSEYYCIDPELKNFPIKENLVDFINIQFTLHHFKNQKIIEKLFSICQKIITPSGSLVIWEETFQKNVDVNELVKFNNRLGIQTDKSLTERFCALEDDQKIEFIAVNDWIINVNNPHMPWTGEYRPWEEWKKLLKKYGFTLDTEYNLGLRINGRLKQGVHMIGVFRPGP